MEEEIPSGTVTTVNQNHEARNVLFLQIGDIQVAPRTSFSAAFIFTSK